jgi:hypothetical protein
MSAVTHLAPTKRAHQIWSRIWPEAMIGVWSGADCCVDMFLGIWGRQDSKANDLTARAFLAASGVFGRSTRQLPTTSAFAQLIDEAWLLRK